MQLKLHENIKRYRKENNLTQESLAEALGVTIGAVSKWENGNTVPDITTLMELANIFNISMDELLGYDKSDKNIEAMISSIKDAYREHNFEDAVKIANAALMRYPHTFKVLYACAEMYYLKHIEGSNDNDTDTAIELLNRSMEYLSQNDDPDISEYSIRFMIATLYRKKDPEKALSELKKIDYDGCNSSAISEILMDMGKMDEALEYSTTALLLNFADQFRILNNMALQIASSGKQKDIKNAIEIADATITVIDTYNIKDKITYISKLKSLVIITKAWWYSCLGDITEMKRCIDDAFFLAVSFDKSGVSSDMSTSIRFYFKKKKSYSYDTIGTSAVAGIDALFTQDDDIVSKKNAKYMDNVIKYWNSLKKSHNVT